MEEVTAGCDFIQKLVIHRLLFVFCVLVNHAALMLWGMTEEVQPAEGGFLWVL